MKKYLIWGGIGVIAIGLVGTVTYWFFFHEAPKPTRGFRDRSLDAVAPVAFPMKGKTFIIPDQPETAVTLDLVAPSAMRDYPMARFAFATGTGEGQIIALDDYTTSLENGLRAVPIVVSQVGTGSYVYLAIAKENEEGFTHTQSVFLGDRIKITSLTRQGNTVTVSYFVHDRNQAMTDTPSVATTAIIDIGTGRFVQEGRKPWLEADTTVRQFTGTYRWQKTIATDGSAVTPSKPDVFTMVFDGPRVTLTTDCNTGSSEFTPPVGTTTSLSFGPVTATKMFCESQEEGPYFAMVTAITNVEEAPNGDLIFSLNNDRQMYFIREGNKIEYSSTTNDGE